VVPWGELFGLVGYCHFAAWLLGCFKSLPAVLVRGNEAGVCLVVSSISQPVSMPFCFWAVFILRGVSVPSICGTFFVTLSLPRVFVRLA